MKKSKTDPYKIVFRIRNGYFRQIVKGTKTFEIRQAKLFWSKRAARAVISWMEGRRVVGVFICGKYSHYRYITEIKIMGSAEQLLGRPLSNQGRLDVGDGPVYIFELGNVIGTYETKTYH